MTGHKARIQTLSFSAESSLLVSGGLDCTVRCWDVKSAGGERVSADGMDGMRRTTGNGINAVGTEHGELPMGPGESSWDADQTWVA